MGCNAWGHSVGASLLSPPTRMASGRLSAQRWGLGDQFQWGRRGADLFSLQSTCTPSPLLNTGVASAGGILRALVTNTSPFSSSSAPQQIFSQLPPVILSLLVHTFVHCSVSCLTWSHHL
jgi:hypothetical protein